MFAIGTPGKVSSVDSGERSGEPSHIEMDSHNEVRLDEDAKDMDLLFALLGRSTVKLSDYRIAIDRFKSLADKYDVTIATPLLAEQLWSQLSDGSLSAGSAFPIAVELEHLGMARCAVDLMNWKCAPATWEWKYVDQIGLRTWYILVRASQGPGILDEESGRPDWTKIARRLAFPPESVLCRITWKVPRADRKRMDLAGGKQARRELESPGSFGKTLSIDPARLYVCKCIDR